MGTPEQKARRADYAAKIQNAWDAGAQGKWTTDAELRAYLNSQGIKGDPIYNQLNSQGGYATYGPQWEPGWRNDFVTNQRIPYQGEGETWYDPSVASNWQNTDPTQAYLMNKFFNWRDQNMDRGLNIDQNYGGNAWLALARTDRPNRQGATLGSLAQRPGAPTRMPGQPIPRGRPWASRPQTLGSLAFPSFPA